MSRFGRLVAVLAVGLLAAVGIGSVLASPGGVLPGDSDDHPGSTQSSGVVTADQLLALSSSSSDHSDEVKILGSVLECPSSDKTVEAKFEREGDKFEVKGTLISLNGTVTVEVTGASENVPNPDGSDSGGIELTADATGAEIKGAPEAGDIVEVEGVVESGAYVAHKIENKCKDEVKVLGDVLECASSDKTVQAKFEQEGEKFEVKGTLVSLSATEVQVTGPDGVPNGNPVTAAVDGDTEIKGDPQPGDFVEVKGSVLSDGSFLAGEVEDECGDGDQSGDSSEDQDSQSSDGDHDGDSRHGDDDDDNES
jgi:hypothetical protein